MATLYLIPSWFYGYDIFFEIIFGLVTLFVAWNAFKIYKVSEEKNTRNLGLGFLLVSLSYFIWACINLFIVSDIGGERVLSLSNILVLSTFSIYAQIFLFIAGLALIASLTLKTNNMKSFELMLVLSFSAIVMSLNKFAATYTIAAIFLLFISAHYISEYSRRKNKITGSIAIAFSLMFLGTVEFLFAGRMYITYVISHMIILVAYMIILAALVTILKHGEKKKQA